MKIRFVLGLLLLTSVQSSSSIAELRPEKVFVADDKKHGSYVTDGLITGGDRTVTHIIVKDIRFALNKGFERIVFDLQGNRNGEPTAIQRPSYYQVAFNSSEKRLLISLWGGA